MSHLSKFQLQQEVSTTEVRPLSKAPNPQLLPRALHSQLPTAPLGWVKCREHISLLIILCIIVYVTNKAHLSLILFVCCLLFAAVGVWPSEARNTGRHPTRESGMTYLKVNLDKVMCVQSYNIKLCHIERGHIFMIHCQTILQIVK